MDTTAHAPLPDRLRPARAGAPSLRRRILGLVAAIAATFLGFAMLALWQVQKRAEQDFAAQLQATTRALALAVDREFSRAEALLEGLARMPALQAGDVEAFLASARIAAEATGLPVIGVAGPDGLQRIMSVAPEERLAAGLAAAPEVLRSFASGRIEIGDSVSGTDPGQQSIVLALPVRDAAGGAVAWVLGAVLPREVLGAAIAAQRLPEDWVAAVLDRRGTVVARTRLEEAFVGRPATPDFLAAVLRGDDAMVARSVNLEGIGTIAAYARAPRSGYGVVIGAPAGAFDDRRRATLVALLAGGLPLGLLAGLLALALVRQVTGALRGLAGPDPRVPGGDAPPRLREVEDLAAALQAERALRDATEARLRERTTWLEAAQQAARIGVWSRDIRGGGSRWSAGMRRILDLPAGPEDADAILPPSAWLAHLHPEDRDRIVAADAGLPTDAPASRREHEFRVVTRSGAIRWVRSQSVVETDAAGRPVHLLGAWIDITDRHALAEAREAALRQRDLLAGEIHHRIRNSLQLVLSLLLLQSRRAVPEAAAALRDAATRVTTIAQVHRRLHEAPPELAGDLGAYLAGLAADLHRTHAAGGEAAGFVLSLAEHVALPPDSLPMVGIIVAELATNAQKYGAAPIRLSLLRRDGAIEIAVEDAGPGFPADVDPAQSRGLGMRVALTLARQLKGSLAVDRSAPGGRVVLTIPEAG